MLNSLGTARSLLRTMSQSSIASFFKPASSPVKPKTISISTTVAKSTDGTAVASSSTVLSSPPRSSQPDDELRGMAEASASRSFPIGVVVQESSKKRNSAMLAAISAGLEEGRTEVKRSKTTNASSSAGVPASIFQQTSTGGPSKPLHLPKATSRAELRASLAALPEKARLLEMEVDTMGEDWLLALQDEIVKPYFLTEFVTKEQATQKVFPPAADVYAWSRLCPLKDVRVVIIGQDPYHDDMQAHGLCFSVRKGIRIPPSLRNIYKEMHDEIPGFEIPKHGQVSPHYIHRAKRLTSRDLTEWAKHGVLLLNTSLTVRAHSAASHSNKGWETFTAAVLKVVTSRLVTEAKDDVGAGANGVVFMAWGSHAQKMCSGVDTKKHLILRSAHPSPLAAARGFFGNKHFMKANEWLETRYGPKGGIDWASLGAQA